MIHALWRRRPRRRAEGRLDPAIARPSAAAIRPVRCAGDLAAVAERLLGEWHAAGTAAAAADLRILSVALLAFSDQLAAEDRERGGGTAWAGEATAAAAYSLAARDIAHPGPGRAVDGVGERSVGVARLARRARVHRQRRAPTMSAPSGGRGAVRPPWLIDRDLDAVAAHLDPWILAAEPDHDANTTAVPLLGTRDWVAADEVTRDAAVALYVIACLAEREPVVIAARVAAEIAAGRTAYLVAPGIPRDQRGHVPPPPAQAFPMNRHVRRGTGWNRPDRIRMTSLSAAGRCAGTRRSRWALWSGLLQPLGAAARGDRAPYG